MNPALLAATSASVPCGTGWLLPHFAGMSGSRVSPRLGNPPSPNRPPPPRAPQPGVRDCCGLSTGAGGPERGWGPSPCPGGREPLCPRGRGRLCRPGPATRWRPCLAVTHPSHASCCRARLPRHRCGSGPRNGCSREPEAGRVRPPVPPRTRCEQQEPNSLCQVLGESGRRAGSRDAASLLWLCRGSWVGQNNPRVPDLCLSFPTG